MDHSGASFTRLQHLYLLGVYVLYIICVLQ